MFNLVINLGYGLLLVIGLVLIIPALTIFERRWFIGSFFKAAQPMDFPSAYRHYLITGWRFIYDVTSTGQIINLTGTALVIGLWLVLPYQMQLPEAVGLVWVYCAILIMLICAFISILAAHHTGPGLAYAGIMQNGLIMLANFTPVIFIVLIIILDYPYRNLSELNRIQQGLRWGFFSNWNLFRSPLSFLMGTFFITNLIIMMRSTDGSFKPSEFQYLSEIQAGQRVPFGNLLSFNRQAILITQSALAVFLFFGGWSAPSDYSNPHFASLMGCVWFLVKTLTLLIICLDITRRLPILSIDQKLNFVLKIQIPVLALIGIVTLLIRWIK